MLRQRTQLNFIENRTFTNANMQSAAVFEWVNDNKGLILVRIEGQIIHRYVNTIAYTFVL